MKNAKKFSIVTAAYVCAGLLVLSVFIAPSMGWDISLVFNIMLGFILIMGIGAVVEANRKK